MFCAAAESLRNGNFGDLIFASCTAAVRTPDAATGREEQRRRGISPSGIGGCVSSFWRRRRRRNVHYLKKRSSKIAPV